ncbi:MAG: hypothetical protein PHS41_04345 [Victivallaceae bacterium]|nr:hypothetical protein [Victivallaceae bacterium]
MKEKSVIRKITEKNVFFWFFDADYGIEKFRPTWSDAGKKGIGLGKT